MTPQTRALRRQRPVVATARLADEAGFAFALISDHQGESPFVWSVLGAIANVIRR